jgi:peroxiredoxin Q/BCP
VVVLAFYPKDFTSGCTAELRTFTEQYADLFGEDVVVVGISADSLETHVRFAQSLGVPFRLLSDPDQKVARKFGSAGERGYNRRTVYVIDRKGRVAYTDLRFGALDPKAYQSLKAAVQDARRAR